MEKDGHLTSLAAEYIYIEIAFVEEWWTDWVLELRCCAGSKLLSLIVGECHTLLREDSDNGRQYCGPRHCSARGGKTV